MIEKIVVIEDDSDLCGNIKAMLEEEGYDIYTSKNGEEGLRLIKKIKPDLIISDILMPGINGYEVLRALQELEEFKLIPFIFLTAKAEPDSLRTGMQLGADDYLTKPFKLNDLLGAVKIRLEKRKAYDKFYSSSKVSKPGGDTGEELAPDDNIFLVQNKKNRLINLSEIKFISAKNQYTNVILNDNSSLIVRKSLTKWAAILPHKKFLRIHRSTIINTDYITNIEKWFNRSFKITLKETEETFILSKRYAAKIKLNF